jgi:hypothetical protein
MIRFLPTLRSVKKPDDGVLGATIAPSRGRYGRRLLKSRHERTLNEDQIGWTQVGVAP